MDRSIDPYVRAQSFYMVCLNKLFSSIIKKNYIHFMAEFNSKGIAQNGICKICKMYISGDVC